LLTQRYEECPMDPKRSAEFALELALLTLLIPLGALCWVISTAAELAGAINQTAPAFEPGPRNGR
jgi:hypothetical protein